jgi:hypothetical protein
MKDKRREFVANPRRCIEEYLKKHDELLQNSPLFGNYQNNIELALLFKNVHKEYGELVGQFFYRINGIDILDEDNLVGNIQRINETMHTITDWSKNNNDVNAIRVSRCFSSLQELLWKKLKIMVRKYNPKLSYINLKILVENLEQIEIDYKNLNLITLKSFVSGSLRNSVDHEDTVFRNPNIIVFMDSKGNKKELTRYTVEELEYEIIKFTIVLTAMQNIESTLICSYMKILLKLSDSLLEEYMRTGIITKEMDGLMQS